MDDKTFYEVLQIAFEKIQNNEIKIENQANIIDGVCFNTISQVNKDEIEILCSDNYTKLNAEVKISIPKRKFTKWILKKLFGITISIKG